MGIITCDIDDYGDFLPFYVVGCIRCPGETRKIGDSIKHLNRAIKELKAHCSTNGGSHKVVAYRVTKVGIDGREEDS